MRLGFVVSVACGLSICWVPGARAQDTQTDQATAACPNPAPFSAPTYQEDNSYLADAQCRTNWLDSIKYIPLATENPNYYLSFGVWIRERSEFFSNTSWGSGPSNEAYLMQRYFAHMDLHLGETFRFFGELASSIEDGRPGGPHSSDEERLYVHQGFFDLGFWHSGKNKIALRAGRQEMEFGSHYLVAARDGRNIRRSFDGFRLTSNLGEWTIDTFAVRPVLDNSGYFDDPPNHAQSFWGVYGTRPFRILPGGNIDLYYLGLNNQSIVIDDKGSGQDQVQNVGSRIWGSKRGWDYNNEYTFQWGNFRSDDIRAWQAITEVGYRLDSVPLRPRFAVRESAFSGNENPAGHTVGTFNSLYQTGPYFTYAELFGNRDLVAVQPSVEISLSNSLTLASNAAPFWRERTSDGLYSSSGSLLVTGQRSGARYIGTQAAAVLKWKMNRHVTATVEYLHFFDGEFLTQSTPGRSVNYLTELLDFRF